MNDDSTHVFVLPSRRAARIALLQTLLQLRLCCLLRTSDALVYHGFAHACPLRVVIALSETSPVLGLRCCCFQLFLVVFCSVRYHTSLVQARALAPLARHQTPLLATCDTPTPLARRGALPAVAIHTIHKSIYCCNVNAQHSSSIS